MIREREIREEFLKTGQITYYEHLRQNKRGKTANLLAAFHELYAGKPAREIECHSKLLISRYEYVLKNNLPMYRILRAVCMQGAENILSHPEIRNGILWMSRQLKAAVRQPETWHCPKGNFQVRFRHLIRHLFASYHVPEFMEKVWMKEGEETHKFYIDLGKGVPVYGHPYLAETVMSRKTAHWFRQAPANCTVEQAVRWAQLRTVRKDKRLFKAVSHSFLGKHFENEKFWGEGMRWLAQQDTVNYAQVRPLLRYINYRKFGRFQLGGVVMPLPAPEPEFNFSGRTFSSMIKAMKDFETTIKMDRDLDQTSWSPVPFPDFDWENHPETEKRRTGFRMVQIVNYKDLVKEGVRQNHCVATYSNSCTQGNTSIWSLRLCEQEDERSLVTVELTNSALQVNQVKGLNNRLADRFEANMVLDWASRIGVEVPEWSLS